MNYSTDLLNISVRLRALIEQCKTLKKNKVKAYPVVVPEGTPGDIVCFACTGLSERISGMGTRSAEEVVYVVTVDYDDGVEYSGAIMQELENSDMQWELTNRLEYFSDGKYIQQLHFDLYV